MYSKRMGRMCYRCGLPRQFIDMFSQEHKYRIFLYTHPWRDSYRISQQNMCLAFKLSILWQLPEIRRFKNCGLLLFKRKTYI